MPNRSFRVPRLFFLVCLAVFIGGCATKLAYDHLDWAISWKVQRLVDLKGDQKEQSKEAIRKFHAWHRQTQLPLYVAYLGTLQDRLNTGKISSADIHAETDKAQLLLEQSLDYVLPDAVAVLSKLDQNQVSELLASITEEREEYIEEYVDVSAKERKKSRYDKFYKRVKDWLGKPNSAQKKQIKAWANTLEPYEAQVAKQQVIWQQQLAELLAQRQDTEALEQGLRSLMLHRKDNWDKELKQVVDRNQERTYSLIADLLNNMSNSQRVHLNKKINDYKQIFDELNDAAK